METAIRYTHLASVILFLLLYLVKTIMLLGNSTALKGFTKATRVPEMIISFLFLGTGVYMLTKLPEINMLMWIKIACVLASIPLAIVGFKKGNKALASVALLLIIGAYGLAEMSKMKRINGGDMNVSNPNNENDGQAIYTANCKGCHGEDGSLGMSGAADLSKSVMDANNMMVVIKEGKGNMQAFDKLSDAQVQAVIKYVQGLKK
jgi:cytochrome c5